MKNEMEQAKDLVTTTENTLRVTAFMLTSAEVLLKFCVKPLEGMDEVVNMQLETFREASEALESLADIYESIGNNRPITEASSLS